MTEETPALEAVMQEHADLCKKHLTENDATFTLPPTAVLYRDNESYIFIMTEMTRDQIIGVVNRIQRTSADVAILAFEGYAMIDVDDDDDDPLDGYASVKEAFQAGHPKTTETFMIQGVDYRYNIQKTWSWRKSTTDDGVALEFEHEYDSADGALTIPMTNQRTDQSG